MTAKEFLNRAYLLDQRIRIKLQQIKCLNEIATNCSSVLTGMPRNPNKATSPMADAVGKIIDLENEVAKDMNILVEIKKDITTVITSVDDPVLRTLLEERYLCGETWEEITICLNRNRRWIFRLHDRALEVVQKIIDEK